MLKGIPALINADLLYILRSMGHGDVLALVDRNFPAQSVAFDTASGTLVHLDGANIPQAAAAILTLYPLDSFVETPVFRMQVVGEPETLLDVHEDFHAACEAAEGAKVRMGSIERHSFYDRARQAFAVVQTTEDRPYGCFLLTKGVVFEPT